MPQATLVGGIAQRRGRSIDIPYREGMRLGDLLAELAKLVPEALEADGTPRPGFLVFVDGVDVRLLPRGYEVKPGTRVHIIQVYHGG